MHLYGHPTSGNVYKTQLLLQLLDMPYELTPTKWGTPEISSPEFLALNPAGRVPVLVDGKLVLPESNAQLWHLAHGTRYWPRTHEEQAQILRWMFWEQYSHEPFIAVRRYLMHYGDGSDATQARIASLESGCVAALNILEQALQGREWLVGKDCSIADLCLFAYTHVAHEAGCELDACPNIRAWIARIEALPGFVPMAAYVEA